jgi:hypothetical protein
MTRGFTRILVPTDFSATSVSALATAKAMAVRLGAANNIDLIVMGTHGRGGICCSAASLSASSATALCPVLTVRGVAPVPVVEERETVGVPAAV